LDVNCKGDRDNTIISGGYYNIVNKNSGLLLDVNGASTTAGAQVIQWNNTGGANQQWVLNSL
jgi:hypothetical protein